MAKKVKNMFKNNMVLCVLILAAIGVTSVVFAADFTIKEGAIKEGIVFGAWTEKDSNTDDFDANEVYQAGSPQQLHSTPPPPNPDLSACSSQPNNKPMQ